LYPEDNSNIVKYLAKILPNITISKAKANLLWLIGHYCKSVLIIVPDILRTFAKTFIKEELQVKYQILNLGAKLVSVDPQPQNLLLFEYVLNLSRYDINYDIRDKARFYRALILNPIRKFIPKDTKEKKDEEAKKEEGKKDEEEEKKENKESNQETENTIKNENYESKDAPTKENENEITEIKDEQEDIDINNETSSLENEVKYETKNEIGILNSKSLDELLPNLQKLLISNKLLQTSNSITEGKKKKNH